MLALQPGLWVEKMSTQPVAYSDARTNATPALVSILIGAPFAEQLAKELGFSRLAWARPAKRSNTIAASVKRPYRDIAQIVQLRK